MRRRWILTTALVVTALAAPDTAASAHNQRPTPSTTASCTLALFAQGAPHPSAIQFGFAACPPRFGNGLHYDAYTVSPISPGHGTIAGRFKNYYDLGTTSGTFALTFSATSPMDITYAGSVSYRGGTGKFRHVKGGGTIKCTSSDGGAHKLCRVNATLTGV